MKKNPLGRISITTMMIAIFSVIIIAVSLIYYIYTRESHIRTYKEGMKQVHNTVMKYIKSGFEQGFEYNDYGFFKEIYNWIQHDDQIKFLVMFNDNSEPIRIIPRGFYGDIRPAELSRIEGRFSSDLPYIVRKMEIRLKNEVFVLYIGFSSQDFVRAEKQIFREVGLRAGFVLVIGLLIAMVIAWSLSSPIKKLKNVAQSIAEGNLELRANEQAGGLEFRELARYFNYMIGQIIQSQEKLVTEMTKHNESVSAQNRILEDTNASLLTEISERIKAEEALKESERLVTSIIDTAPAALAYIDRSRTYLHVNEFWASLIGRSIHDIIGTPFSDSAPQPLQEILDVPGVIPFISREVELTVDGNNKVFMFYANPHYSTKEEFLGTVLFMVDISQIKEYEEELLISREEAVVANKHKSDFLASMSHEIRTPMNAIIGFGELLQNRLRNSRNQEYLNSIITSSRNLLKIINDILDLSKIEANKFELQLEIADIRNIVFDIEQIFSIKVSQKGLALRSVVDDSIPKALLVDESRIRQILLNIVGNSVKFTSSGFIEINVKAENTDCDNRTLDLKIEVTDSGIGIAENELQQIFEAFHQPNDQKLKTYGGTGLGLTISRKLVEMMKGDVSVESRLNYGTKFTIRLPGIRITEEKPCIQDPADDPTSNYDFKEARILIVDDIEFNRKLIRELLKPANLQLFEAMNGKDAVDRVEEINPDIILMDMKMPDMDGFQSTSLLRQKLSKKKVPIVLISASTMKSDEDSVLSQFDDYLLKPVVRADIVKVLKKYLPYTARKEKAAKPPIPEDIPMFNVNGVEFVLTNEDGGAELLSILDAKYRVAKDVLKETLMLSELQSFAKSIIECGERFREDSIIFFGNDLLRYCDNLDFEKIMAYLGDYDILVDRLKRHLSSAQD